MDSFRETIKKFPLYSWVASSLVAKLVIPLLLIALVPLALSGFFTYRQARAELEQEAGAKLENVAATTAEKIDRTLSERYGDVQAFASTNEARSMDPQALRNLADRLTQVYAPNYDLVVVADASGKIVAVNRYGVDGKSVNTFGLLNRDVSNESWFQAATTRTIPTGQSIVEDVHADPLMEAVYGPGQPSLAMSFTSPILDATGDVVGVWTNRYNWDALVADLQEQVNISVANGDETVDLHLLNSAGTIVASNDTEFIMAAQLDSNQAVVDAIAEGGAGYRETKGIDNDSPNEATLFGYAVSDGYESYPGAGWTLLVTQKKAEAGSAATTLGTQAFFFFLAAAGVAVAAAVFFVRRIASPLTEVAEAAERVSAGDYSARADVSGASFEVGAVAHAFNDTLDQLTNVLGRVQRDHDSTQRQIVKLLTEVSGIAEGDLTVEAEVTADTLGSVADSVNYMVSELRKIVSNVNETTVAVSSSSTDIMTRSNQLAVAAEVQATQIAETSTAVAEMATSIQQVSSNALMSADVAREARHNAQAGAEAMRATIDGMVRIRQEVQETSRTIKRLGESSQEIGQIVQLIEEIANQTNLLALNAAIQAAMAGEHGRGFAVVAEEVRRLAERAASATKQIDSLVTSIQAETANAVVSMDNSTREVVLGSQLADEAGVALTTIDSVIMRLGELIEAIALAAEQQARASTEIARSMSEISHVTEETSAGTRDAAQSVSHLANLAERLRQSVSAFKLSKPAADSSWNYGSSPASDD